jgi:hypothetical protein
MCAGPVWETVSSVPDGELCASVWSVRSAGLDSCLLGEAVDHVLCQRSMKRGLRPVSASPAASTLPRPRPASPAPTAPA